MSKQVEVRVSVDASRFLRKMAKVIRHMPVTYGRKISEQGVTVQEAEFEADFADGIEPLLVGLYEAGLGSVSSQLPQDETEMVDIFVRAITGTAAAAALLAFLRKYLLSAYNIGGGLSLLELGIDGEFSLIDQGVIDQINAYADELLAQLIATTANDLAAQVKKGRDNGLGIAAILVVITDFLVLRTIHRANVIAMNETVTGTRWGMIDAYRRNGILFVEFNTQRDGNVDNGDPLGPCVVQDGMVFEINNIPPGARIPIHIGCRCYYKNADTDWIMPTVIWFG